ncbi:MAG: ABC transporter substrate-binding protein, partial [Chloroflexota bacterium]|nr:ABC transporter substrate-binding protein [Chloroflexota bacterium]
APSAASAARPTTLSDGKIVIAVLNDQSGVYADLGGQNAVRAVRMAVDDFLASNGQNALGGSIEVISADHQNKPDLANSKAQEFIDRNQADVIMDVPTSSAALAVAGVARDRRKLYLNVTAATTELTGKDCNRYTFHYAYDTYMLANGTGTEVTRSTGKSWYIIYPNYAFGQDMEKSFRAAIEKSGGRVVASDPTPFPNDDFSSFLLKAPTLQPEVLGTMQAGQDLVNVVKQYNEFKLRDQKIPLAIGLLFDTDIHAIGPYAYAGVLYTTAWNWALDAQSREWADRFSQSVGGNMRPTFSHAGNYSAAMQYLEAVRRAGSDDADAVVAQLEGHSFSDFFIRNGHIRKDDHRVVHDAYLAEVKPASEVKEPWDYSRIVRTIPAEQAFRPASESRAAGCSL